MQEGHRDRTEFVDAVLNRFSVIIRKLAVVHPFLTYNEGFFQLRDLTLTFDRVEPKQLQTGVPQDLAHSSCAEDT